MPGVADEAGGEEDNARNEPVDRIVELTAALYVHDHEQEGVSKVLNAAALTYVAALVSAILNLLYFLTLARNNRN